jgi:hypothetical protein
MSAPRVRGPRLTRLLLPVVTCFTAHCGTRVVYAVDLSQKDDAATGSIRDHAPDAGQDSMSISPGGADSTGSTGSSGQVVWPNQTSRANSADWLVEHHDEITEIRPNVLVLDFYNRESPGDAQQKAQQMIDAIAEASKYHGYSDPTAPAFVNYHLFKFVDLTDEQPPPNWPYVSSTKVPISATGGFSISALFSTSFAINYGVPDPTDPNRYLALCELFERGLINELWLMVGDGARNTPLMVESKQVYDAQNRPVSGMFNPCTGYVCLPPNMPHCLVTARIAHLDPSIQGPGCDLVPRSIGIENMRFALGYMKDNASDFFNDAFKAHYATDFNSWTELVTMGGGYWCTPRGRACIGYPSQTIAQGTYPDGGSWEMNPFVQGCGNAHFPPNAQFEWDYTNTQPVQSRCENYGMHGSDGVDRVDVYTSAKEAASAPSSGDDCAGGWQIYLRQSMPGLHNTARAIDGSPMKNWWPFLFY